MYIMNYLVHPVSSGGLRNRNYAQSDHESTSGQ